LNERLAEKHSFRIKLRMKKYPLCGDVHPPGQYDIISQAAGTTFQIFLILQHINSF